MTLDTAVSVYQICIKTNYMTQVEIAHHTPLTMTDECHKTVYYMYAMDNIPLITSSCFIWPNHLA